MSLTPESPPLWRHIKTGNRYELLFVARDCTNGDRDGRDVAVYQREGEPDRRFCRDLVEFEQKFVPELSQS